MSYDGPRKCVYGYFRSSIGKKEREGFSREADDNDKSETRNGERWFCRLLARSLAAVNVESCVYCTRGYVCWLLFGVWEREGR